MRGNIKLKKIGFILQALLLLAVPVFAFDKTEAASGLSNRSIFVRNPIANASTEYDIKFTIVVPGALGDIRLQFCDNSPLLNVACDVPLDFDILGSTLALQSGEVGYSYDMVRSTSNELILTRAPAYAYGGQVNFKFTNVINPSRPNRSLYLRITTYQSAYELGLVSAQGAAAFAINSPLATQAYIPSSLYFCVGVTVASDCSTTSGSYVSFGDLSPSKVSAVTTQFAAATNDEQGYVVYANGTTLLSGNNVITAISSPNPSLAGFRQFGINLRNNTNPNVGGDISGTGTGQVMPNYDTPDIYMFDSGAAIAEATQPTEYNRYTVTYIANVSLDQPVGVYVTTLTYVAVAQF